jgi:hypothetical protein
MESIKILMIDDEAPIREMIKKGLSQMGGIVSRSPKTAPKPSKGLWNMTNPDYLAPNDLPRDLMEEFSEVIKRGVKGRKSLDDIKSEYIREILKVVGGNKKIASEILKVNPRTLYRSEKKKTNPNRSPLIASYSPFH